MTLPLLLATTCLLLQPPAQRADAVDVPPASLKGHVLRADGQPLVRATVRIYPVGRFPIGKGTATDADGSYEFTDLAPGRYRLLAGKPGFVSVGLGQRTADEEPVVIELKSGQAVERIDITLPRNGTISGRIIDENGEPVEGAQVRVQQVRFSEGRYQFIDVAGSGTRFTNDLGRFRVYGVPPGKYFVSAVVGLVDFPGPGMVNLPGYAPTFYPGTPLVSDAQAVPVGLSQDVSGIDFALVATRTVRVTGRAITSAGDPITGGLTMRPTARSGSAGSATGARIDRLEGTFEFPNVPQGEYVIEAFRGRVTNDQEGEFAARFVTVNDVDVTDVLIRTSAGTMLTGRVVLEGGVAKPDAFEIQALPADPDRAPSARGGIGIAAIRPDWTFHLGGVNGPRRIRLTSAPDGWSLKTVRINGSDVTDSVLSFGDRGAVDDIEITLTRVGGSIVGGLDVTGAGESPAYSVLAFATDPDLWYEDSRYVARVASRNGVFRLGGLPPGEYYVVALDRVRGDEWQDPQLLSQLAQSARRCIVGEGQQATLTLPLLSRAR